MNTVQIGGKTWMTYQGLQNILREKGWDFGVKTLGSSYTFTATRNGAVYMFSMGKGMIIAEIRKRGSYSYEVVFSEALIHSRFFRLAFESMQQKEMI